MGQSSPRPSRVPEREIDGSEAQRDAAPVIGAAADDARAEPLEIGAGRGGVGLAVNVPGAVGREEFAEIFGLAWPPTPTPRCGSSYGHVNILKSFSGLTLRAGFEHGARSGRLR